MREKHQSRLNLLPSHKLPKKAPDPAPKRRDLKDWASTWTPNQTTTRKEASVKVATGQSLPAPPLSKGRKSDQLN